MPRRDDIHSILIIGSGPIIIGQACEFDYSGTQALKALKEENYEVILLNSNPATIMTDPEFADRTYLEPLTVEYLEKIIQKEKPDALLATLGGQKALNLALELDEAGILKEHKIQLIGVNTDSIRKAEDRLLFRRAMEKIGLEVPESGYASSLKEAVDIVKKIKFPVVIRPSFTLGGTGGNVLKNWRDFYKYVPLGLAISPISRILIEKSIIGYLWFMMGTSTDPTGIEKRFLSQLAITDNNSIIINLAPFNKERSPFFKKCLISGEIHFRWISLYLPKIRIYCHIQCNITA